MNPGSPAPQAGILDQSRCLGTEIPAPEHKLDDDPISNNGLIINTLISMKKDGKAENTINVVRHSLTRLAKYCNLSKPESVKVFLSTATKQDGKTPLENSTKNKIAFAYNKLCEINEIQWKPPYYKYEPKIPLIPTTENVNKIISGATKRYATIFTIMAETGVEGEELHATHRNMINTETGEISIQGRKGHASGKYKLKHATLLMLIEYMEKNPQDYPFPKPKIMGQVWTETRTRVADRLKQPQLREIPLKSLRNYSGAQLYKALPIRDPIMIMRHLRHKKLETTMHYLRGIVLDFEENEEWICRIATTSEECSKLIESGFTKADEIDGKHLYRKRK